MCGVGARVFFKCENVNDIVALVVLSLCFCINLGCRGEGFMCAESVHVCSLNLKNNPSDIVAFGCLLRQVIVPTCL